MAQNPQSRQGPFLDSHNKTYWFWYTQGKNPLETAKIWIFLAKCYRVRGGAQSPHNPQDPFWYPRAKTYSIWYPGSSLGSLALPWAPWLSPGLRVSSLGSLPLPRAPWLFRGLPGYSLGSLA